jgi:hypothetical protein
MKASLKQSKDMKTKSGNLKKIAAIVLTMSLVIVGCLFFQHCQKVDTETDYTLNVPEEFMEVGKIHNEGLDYIFAELQEKCIEYAMYIEEDPINAPVLDYPAIARKATIDFCRTTIQTKDYSELYKASILNSGLVLKSQKVPEMNSKQKEYLNEVALALKAEFKSKNLKRFKGELSSINKDASMELSENDAAVIYCATSTAYNTFQYWNRNYRAWYFALNYPEIFGQYKKAELNKMSLKSAVSTQDTTHRQPDWTKIVWDRVEGWFVGMADAVDIWWDQYGEGIVLSDCVGAACGAGDAIAAAGAASLVFGPEGLVAVGAGGAIIGGVDASAKAVVISGSIIILDN